MRNVLSVLLALTVFSACTGNVKQETESAKEEVAVLSVDEIQQSAADYVGKTVAVTGTVTHVCKQTGERCYLMGNTESASIRVEAGKSIGSFTQELMGSDLKVSGELAEFQVDETYLNEKEALALEGKESNEDHIFGNGGSGKHDEATGLVDNERLKQIAEMRQQLQESGKPSLTIYYIKGDNYQETE